MKFGACIVSRLLLVVCVWCEKEEGLLLERYQVLKMLVSKSEIVLLRFGYL